MASIEGVRNPRCIESTQRIYLPMTPGIIIGFRNEPRKTVIIETNQAGELRARTSRIINYRAEYDSSWRFIVVGVN